VLGKKLEAVWVDPGVELAAVMREGRRTAEKDKVAWCSAAGPRCRASRAAVFEKDDGLLFYPGSTRARNRPRT